MPPRDKNVIDGTLYFEDENGELKPICIASEINVTDITSDTDCKDLVPGLFHNVPYGHLGFTFAGYSKERLSIASRDILGLPVPNNYRRLHWVRAKRHAIHKHKPERWLKKHTGGFEFK